MNCVYCGGNHSSFLCPTKRAQDSLSQTHEDIRKRADERSQRYQQQLNEARKAENDARAAKEAAEAKELEDENNRRYAEQLALREAEKQHKQALREAAEKRKQALILIKNKNAEGLLLTKEEQELFNADQNERRQEEDNKRRQEERRNNKVASLSTGNSGYNPVSIGLFIGGVSLIALVFGNPDKKTDVKPPKTDNGFEQTIKATPEKAPEPSVEELWKDAPVFYYLKRHVRMQWDPDLASKSNHYLMAGSCVSASQGQKTENGFLNIDAESLKIGTRFGYIPADALDAGKKAEPGVGCLAAVVQAGKDTPLPAQPAVALTRPQDPATLTGEFSYARFYTVYGANNMRKKPDRAEKPFAAVHDGSCVLQHEFKGASGKFVQVLAIGDKMLSGWVLTQNLRPAPAGTTENDCRAKLSAPEP